MHELRIVYFAHSLRADWNNGNAHFLRGLCRALTAQGAMVTILEPRREWSINNLRAESEGERSIEAFTRVYPDLKIQTYESAEIESKEDENDTWPDRLRSADIVILHEWNPPALSQRLLSLREKFGFRLLFHDTHHRASSSPEQMKLFCLNRFDGVLAFGEELRAIYRERFNMRNVWTLHEAADTTVFKPAPGLEVQQDVVWIGNWGEEERAAELREFLLMPAAALNPHYRFKVYGVRYPEDGLTSLKTAGILYGAYLPNLDAPRVYAESRLTLHVPRQQYSGAMQGIPTIRVFEALACGIPLISAPWNDVETLFRRGDFLFASNGAAMQASMTYLLQNPAAAEDQAGRGLETIQARHTCIHRAQELTAICKELLS